MRPPPMPWVFPARPYGSACRSSTCLRTCMRVLRGRGEKKAIVRLKDGWMDGKLRRRTRPPHLGQFDAVNKLQSLASRHTPALMPRRQLKQQSTNIPEVTGRNCFPWQMYGIRVRLQTCRNKVFEVVRLLRSGFGGRMTSSRLTLRNKQVEGTCPVSSAALRATSVSTRNMQLYFFPARRKSTIRTSTNNIGNTQQHGRINAHTFSASGHCHPPVSTHLPLRRRPARRPPWRTAQTAAPRSAPLC